MFDGNDRIGFFKKHFKKVDEKSKKGLK